MRRPLPSRRAAALFILLALAGPLVHAQSTERIPGLVMVDTITMHPGDTLQLSRPFLVPASLLLQAGARITGPDSSLMDIDPRWGRIVLRPVFFAGLDTSRALRIVVTYQTLPLRIADEYRRYDRALLRPDAGPDDTRHITARTTASLASYFGADMQKSGYLGRGFTVGSNRDAGITSSFRLQLAGNLSKDITILAALTDENTPIQPEGNTRTLQELDKVFVKISGPHASATLGDYVLSWTGTEFGRISRKLSGIQLEGFIDEGTASFAYASMKGLFHSMQFNGTDGVQGPYLLRGRNGEPRIVVLAGTERVYVDGLLMERGDNADYVIEYGNGEITFRPRRLITSYSRITVDFEYADRPYLRSFLSAQASTRFLRDRLAITTRYLREGDDPDAPIDFTFSDSDRAILEAAGDQAQAASRSGAVYVGRDSVRGFGAGSYMRVDTMLTAGPTTLWRYAPGTDSATYAVSFSWMGEGQGDYNRSSFGVYSWVGPGMGSYAPVQRLPLPVLQQALVTEIIARPLANLTVQGEGAFSRQDQNRLSSRDKGNDGGGAWNTALRWTDLPVGLGSVELSARLRHIDARFSPLDRINDIEFSRRWDVGTTPEDERMEEGAVTWKPWSLLALRGGVGHLSRGASRSRRLEGGLDLVPHDSLPSWPRATVSLEQIDRTDAMTSSLWRRSRGQAEGNIGLLTPKFRFETEHREARDLATDSVLASSLAFSDVRPGLEVRALGPLSLSAELGWRAEQAVLGGALRSQAMDRIQTYGLQLRSWNALSAQAAVTIRDRTVTEDFRRLGQGDLQTILTRLSSQYAPWKRAVTLDLLYEVSTERTARQERSFFAVPLGQGNYVYAGDRNGNGVQDVDEFEPTRFDGDYVMVLLPSQTLVPTIDVRTGLRVALTPSIIWSAGTSWWKDLLRNLGSETTLRIEEKSTDPVLSHVTLLRTSGFLNDSTTIRGFQTIRQDLLLFDQNPEFSIRLRTDHSRALTQFASATERSYRRENSIRLKSQLVREIGLNLELASSTDRLSSGEMSNRSRDIEAMQASGDLAYRPWPRIETGFVLTMKSATDHRADGDLEAAINAQTLRTVLSFEGPGRLRLELERNEVVLSSSSALFPFELTDGRPEGRSWVWRLNVDYRLLSSVQATISYLGRVEGLRPAVHTGRAEVKAFF